MPLDGRSLGIALGINLAIATVAFGAFFMLLRSRYTRRFFLPKLYSSEVDDSKRPRRWAGGLPELLRNLWSYPQAEIAQVAGHDGATYLRCVEFGWNVFIPLTVYCLLVVLPVNYSGGQVDSLMAAQAPAPAEPEIGTGAREPPKPGESYFFTDIDKTSLSNVPPGSRLMWVHVVSIYVVTFVLLRALWRFSKAAVSDRVDYLSAATESGPGSGPAYTVLVTDVPGLPAGTLLDRVHSKMLWWMPKSMKNRVERLYRLKFTMAGLATGPAPAPGAVAPRVSPWKKAVSDLGAGFTVQELVSREFEELFGQEDVAAVTVAVDEAKLAPLMASYEKEKANLEHLLDWYAEKLQAAEGDSAKKKKIAQQTMRVFGRLYGAWGTATYGNAPKKVDALEFHAAWLEELRRQVVAERARAAPQPAAFVSFNHRWTQVVAATSLHARDEGTWATRQAPATKEVLWHKLPMRQWERSGRYMLVWAACIALLLFYTIPVSALQAILQINTLEEVPAIKWIMSVSFIRSLITGILPGLALKIFIALLPAILTALNMRAGWVSVGEVDSSVVSMFYLFQLWLVFFTTFIAGTLLNQIQQFISEPASILRVLGTGAPQTATFFITFVLVNALISKPVGLLRVVPLIIYALRYRFAATDRARRKLWQDQQALFGAGLTDHTIILLLGLAFAVINPLILPFVLLYFAIASLTERFQVIYVFNQPYESGGILWRKVVSQAMTALYIAQILAVALLGIKQFEFAPLIIPAIIFTYIFHRSLSNLFRRPWKVLSLRDARDLDAEEAAGAKTAASTSAGAVAPIAGPLPAASDLVPGGAAAAGRELSPATPEEAVRPGKVAGVPEYVHPAFHLSDADHAALMAEAAATHGRVRGLLQATGRMAVDMAPALEYRAEPLLQ